MEQAKENCRDQRKVNWVQDLLGDVQFGGRMLRQSSGFTVVVVLTLALGIGANTAIFSAARAVFLGSMPFPDSKRLVFVSRGFPGFPQGGGNFSYPGYREMAAENSSFDTFVPFSKLRSARTHQRRRTGASAGRLRYPGLLRFAGRQALDGTIDPR